MDYRVGKLGRTIAIALRDGEDVYASVHEVARKENVRCAAIIAVGGVRKAKVVTGPKDPHGPIDPDFREFDDAREIVGTGTLFWDESAPQMHIHMAFGRGDKPLVGCPRGGAFAFCVLEIIMIELADIDASRALDPELGLKLLIFSKK
jgi:predicted DNA-binding protein with PD1-like motif